MKKFIATFALVATVMGIQAQNETKDFVNYERGYRADIALSTSISEQYSITTSHGYSFGNGLYVGGGVGFTAETFLNFEDEPHYLVPLFGRGIGQVKTEGYSKKGKLMSVNELVEVTGL